MTDTPILSRRLRRTRRRVAARLDLTGHDHEAAIVRGMSVPELEVLAALERTP